jgi:hypothetical protein
LLYHLLKTDPSRFYEHSDFTGYWYYSIEVEPGKFTAGFEFPNLGLTRNLLRRIGVEGLRCYDIGTMEGLIATLLAKRNAREVVATDVVNYVRKVNLVQDLHGIYFDYHPNVQLDDLLHFMKNRTRIDKIYRDDGGLVDRYDYRSDLTTVAGMLYHVFSPFHLLGYARSLTRLNGLVLIETAALKTSDFYMRYNFTGSKYIYGWSDTWYPTLPLLDYMLRMCKLQPLDMVWLHQWQFPDLIRVAMVCRAVAEPDAAPGETLMVESTLNMDHNIFVETFGEPTDRPPVPFDIDENAIVVRENQVSCDLYATAVNRPAYVPAPDDLRLWLDATG